MNSDAEYSDSHPAATDAYRVCAAMSFTIISNLFRFSMICV